MKTVTIFSCSFAVLTIITFIELCLTSPVNAQNSPENISKFQSFQEIAQVNCEEVETVPQANECLRVADLELNQTYQQLIKTLAGQERQKLILAEQSWIKYRDTNCAFRIREFTLNTSMGRRFYSLCKERMTRDRTAELKR